MELVQWAKVFEHAGLSTDISLLPSSAQICPRPFGSVTIDPGGSPGIFNRACEHFSGRQYYNSTEYEVPLDKPLEMCSVVRSPQSSAHAPHKTSEASPE